MATWLLAWFGAAAATVVVVIGFVKSDQTLQPFVGFASLWLVGVTWPLFWTRQLLGALGVEDERTRRLAWAPMIVGSTTILLGAAAWILRG